MANAARIFKDAAGSYLKDPSGQQPAAPNSSPTGFFGGRSDSVPLEDTGVICSYSANSIIQTVSVMFSNAYQPRLFCRNSFLFKRYNPSHAIACSVVAREFVTTVYTVGLGASTYTSLNFDNDVFSPLSGYFNYDEVASGVEGDVNREPATEPATVGAGLLC
jgi:hypothetical protein